MHDNIVQQLDKNSTVENREVESQHLLVVLSSIGREYWIPESALLKYFGIRYDATSNEYSRTEFLNHFSITTILTYIKDKKRYKGLRSFIEEHIASKLGYKKAHCPNDAEALILLLDLLTCPYLSAPVKASIGGIFGLDASSSTSIQLANNYWFTAWGKEFDLGKELDSKRSREVY